MDDIIEGSLAEGAAGGGGLGPTDDTREAKCMWPLCQGIKMHLVPLH